MASAHVTAAIADTTLASASTGAHSQAPSLWTAADQASVDRYLASGDRMGVFAGVVWKVGIVIVVLILAAWFMGVLPVAVRLF